MDPSPACRWRAAVHVLGRPDGFALCAALQGRLKPQSEGCSCRRSTCEACAWALARLITHRILVRSPKHLLEIEVDVSGAKSWKIQLRNVVDFRRRAGSRPANWTGLGAHLWSSSDGHSRGIITLTGPIPTDLVQAFSRRWPTRMRVIDAEELRGCLEKA